MIVVVDDGLRVHRRRVFEGMNAVTQTCFCRSSSFDNDQRGEDLLVRATRADKAARMLHPVLPFEALRYESSLPQPASH